MSYRIICSLVVSAHLLLVGCAGFSPRPVEQLSFLERAQTQTADGLKVTVAVPSTAEARELFDTKLHKKRIQPVWVSIENLTEKPTWFFPFSVDRDYFPPLEVAWKSHRTWAKKTNRKIDAYYYENRARVFVPAGATSSGFVFVSIDRGMKHVPLQLLTEESLTEFEFVFGIPGFKADFDEIDLDAIYAGTELRDLSDEQALREWITALACCTTNKKGTGSGDPVNFVLIAPEDSLALAFARAGWDLTAAMTTGTALKTATSAVFGKTYRHAPISPLYFFGRPQDLGLQKARWNIHQRNHLRMWLAPVTYRGAEVWVGQISRDIGSRLTTKSSTMTTHKIDPDIDEARNFVVLDLWTAGSVAAFGYTTGVGMTTPDEPGRNLTGDPYFTGGLRAVMILSDETVELEEVRLLGWERPSWEDGH